MQKFQHIPGYDNQWFNGLADGSGLVCWIPESSVVRGAIRVPRITLRGRPGVLYDGFFGCFTLSDFNKVVGVVWGGGAEVYSMSCLLIQLLTYSIQFVDVW